LFRLRHWPAQCPFIPREPPHCTERLSLDGAKPCRANLCIYSPILNGTLV
jgi:hypothetical protein